MSARDDTLLRLVCVSVLAVVGGLFGVCAGLTGWLSPELMPARQVIAYPYPHHIPKYRGGVSLRFAMVHDVIHERYPRHGPPYYAERNRLVRKALDRVPEPGGESKGLAPYFALLDDLGVGLEFVGERDEAARVLRDKLRRQELLGQRGRELYTTYANLGTVLIHSSFPRAQAGDAKARETLREGLAYIHKSIEVNPEAHFGREIWQAAVVEYLLACLDNPALLSQYDLVGDRLDKDIDPRQKRCLSNPPDWDEDAELMWGKLGMNRDAAEYLQGNREHTHFSPKELRGYITRVGAEEGWSKAVKNSQPEPVPFDEPALGIVGMWRLGGGANPHFSLALSEIMLRVGQRRIAWCGYERTVLLANRYWPDAEIQRKLTEHCRRRQALIEGQLSPAEAAKLRPRFEAELASGQRYQRSYQEYEAKQIAAGVSIEGEHFYDAFHADHKPIASPTGPADQFLVDADFFRAWRLNPAVVLLFAGISGFSVALLLRIVAAFKKSGTPWI
jgi:hypothetical protein